MLPIARHLRRQGAVQITRFSRPTIVNQRHLTCQSPRCQAQHSSPELEKQPKKGPLDRFKKSGSPTSKTEGEKSKTAPVRTILRQSADLPIRTRFAPSPTGYLHLGSLRTALFNNLVSAASNGGTFILRIEDTDQSRLVPDAEDRIREGLKWFGLSWDEGPDLGGPYGPYRQSERLPIYQEHVKTLLDKEHAYRCFCTSEQLAEQKRILHEAGQSSNYPGTCRSIAKEESDERSAKGESHVIRFKGSDFGTPKFVDAIYGPFQKKEAEEDFILMKTDGYPTYHFANVVDDYLMKITHVVRGEEWLISTPKHVALYQAFGWKAPTFAHLGLLNNDDGSKLSKRNDSANLSSYQAQGYSPMALQMWLANLGSSFIKSKHVPRTLRQVADLLSFRFTKGGIKLNFEKLDYFETQYRNAITRSPEADLAESETPIFTTLILQPTVREALKLQNATASEFSGWSNAAWEGEKELVPLMAENTRQDYVEKVIRANQYGGKDDALRLIPQSPHYFYRPPVALYEACAKGLTGGEKAVLDALSAVCDERMWWQTDGGAVTTQEVQSQLPIQGIESKIFLDNVDAVTVHRVIRLVATGAPDVASQPSGTLLAILGHEEMKHRTALVKDLVSKADI